jgi:hypothetical protein
MNMHKLSLLLLSAFASLGAVAATPAAISRLQLEFTTAAQKQVDDDARFNSTALRKSLGDALTARGLADLDSDSVASVAVIEVDEFDVRAASNVVFMGRVASRGVLGGKVRIRDSAGKQMRELPVRVEVSLRIRKGNTDKNALAGLYDEFAEQTADELAGTVRPSKQKRPQP